MCSNVYMSYSEYVLNAEHITHKIVFKGKLL